jgi:hypothetical protein
MVHPAAAEPPVIIYTGDGSDLQEVIDAAAFDATITFDAKRCLEISKSITVRRPLRLSGLNARLPKKVGRTPILLVAAEGVTLSELELHGNYDSVSQDDRAPLIHVTKGRFKAERCVFCDASKDGIMVEPERSASDIVDVVIRDIKAQRMGRDAVSISGGNRGQRVRNVLVENVRLQRGYFRGAVEVSDGTDSVTVRHVYAEDAVYAIDVQDHGTTSAPNTNVLLEDVTAVNCKHVVHVWNLPDSGYFSDSGLFGTYLPFSTSPSDSPVANPCAVSQPQLQTYMVLVLSGAVDLLNQLVLGGRQAEAREGVVDRASRGRHCPCDHERRS